MIFLYRVYQVVHDLFQRFNMPRCGQIPLLKRLLSVLQDLT